MNAMTEAFLFSLTGKNIKGNVGQIITRSKGGVVKEGWNAKLSYRTHQALLKDGYTKFSGQ